MQLKGERIGRSTTKAFATPWEVCFNVASSNITADVTFEAGKTYLVLGTNTVKGGIETVTVAEVGAVIAAVNAWTMG